MKKLWILLPISLCVVAGFRYVVTPSNLSSAEIGSHGSRDQPQKIHSGYVSGHSSAAPKPIEAKSKESDSVTAERAHPGASGPEGKGDASSSAADSQTLKPEGSAVAPIQPEKFSLENGPSIGTVKVLGHRGCDTNTQGWYLSVGNPEQYDFTVSEDGETVVVEPNTPNLTGNFEFVRCADTGQLSGKRVRFSARIKAQEVRQTAQLRIRGEDFRRERNLYADVKVAGNYDWKDFSVEAEVTPEVALFSYGLTFRSSGKLWISNPSLSIIP